MGIRSLMRKMHDRVREISFRWCRGGVGSMGRRQSGGVALLDHRLLVGTPLGCGGGGGGADGIDRIDRIDRMDESARTGWTGWMGWLVGRWLVGREGLQAHSVRRESGDAPSSPEPAAR